MNAYRHQVATLLATLLLMSCVVSAQHVSEDVTFSSGGLVLAGTLTLPAGSGPHPVVVAISGSGPQTRAGEVPGVPGYGLFADLAPFLAERGVAVLRYDDRGVGDSEGDNATATSGDLAGDTEAAVRYLQSRSEVDPLWIGLLGHSEGGMIAPMIAARHPGIAFVIALAPPVAEALEGLVRQERLMLETEGLPQELVEAQVAMTREALELTRAGAWDALDSLLRATIARQLAALPEEQRAAFGDLEEATEVLMAQTMTQYRGWMHYFLSHDSQADWERMRVPALAVFGGRDVQVDPIFHRRALEEVADARLVAIETLPEANHLFQDATTGGVTEYPDLPPQPTPRLLETLDGWLRANVPIEE